MLVDASHPEETRVVVLNGSRVEEFDYENAERLQLKGNIYLAKVTRVEPSLQACFVEYGGNRHGFLPFSEIHPDYYRIPTEDRAALLAAERAAERHSDDEDEEEDDAVAGDPSLQQDADSADHEPVKGTEAEGHEGHDGHGPGPDGAAEAAASDQADDHGEAAEGQSEESGAADGGTVETVESAGPPETIETVGSVDAMEEVPTRRQRPMRRYKIQEVIARKQILLIQVVKEERGSKGAALTTFLSLAGRYCVLMPNTDRGGGISRKIANPADRRKLKELAHELDVPEGMGLIIRTAGANRTKQEIRRDFEYLMREWDAVRDLTLKSTAPTLVYEEGSLIKRAIRDLFSKDIDQILVEGEAGHEEAREFMRLIMPSNVDMVERFAQPLPLYQSYGVEAQLDSMFQPTVRLRSGGYIVINQTEALVAIDVNSGKATREHNIEDTALKTNVEAAEEIARQLRLRDLAGLIVIDFIDMEEGRNNRHVEKRLKDALKWDRARIQVGRISPFGLLEMSRQRLRSGMVEGSTVACPHCEGRGLIRSVGSMALRVLRAVEEHCQRQREPAITLRLPPEIAIYILNHKRGQLNGIEERHRVYIYIEAKPSLTASSYEIEHGSPVAPPEPRRAKKAASAVSLGSVFEAHPLGEDVDADVDETAESDLPASATDAETESGAQAGDRQGRRKRRRRGRGRDERAGGERLGGERVAGERISAERSVEERSAGEHGAAPKSPGPVHGSMKSPERPLGIPSPAEFNFGHHDWPDTSPDAVDQAQTFGDGAPDDEADSDDGIEAGGQDAATAGTAADGERRRRRGRRGRRGRGRDRDGPRGDGGEGTAPRAQGERRERPHRNSGILSEPPAQAAGGFTHPSLVRPEPQFSVTQVPPEPLVQPAWPAPSPAEVQTEPERREPKTEAKPEWSLSSFLGFGSKAASKDREPARESPPPPPVLEKQEKEAATVEAEPQPDAPKRGGWWQRRG
jgi:ribonuclease E